MKLSNSTFEEEEELHESQPLIPGLPDEVAETCLLYLPYPYQSLVRSVSSSWKKAINNPIFLLSKKTLSLSLPTSLPYIFVFSFHKPTGKFQCQAFNPRSTRWFILPPLPFPYPVSPSSFACASCPREGMLYVLGGMRSDCATETPLHSLISYSTSTNKWSSASPMRTPRSYFAAGVIGSKIFAAGGSSVGDHDDTILSTECYDPVSDTWTSLTKMRSRLARYEVAVIGNKMYVTEGWTWPFTFSPRGGVYNTETDTWEEMRIGMREGWTGVSVVVDDRLFVISEHGDCRVKFYVPKTDTWRYAEGNKFPCEELRRPFSVSAAEGKIYVVSYGFNVAIGSVLEEERKSFRVEWEVVKGPQAFEDFSPSNSQVVYG